MSVKPELNYIPEDLSSLSAKYKVSNRMMRAWLEDLHPEVVIKHKKIFSPREIRLIIEHLGPVD